MEASSLKAGEALTRLLRLDRRSFRPVGKPITLRGGCQSTLAHRGGQGWTRVKTNITG